MKTIETTNFIEQIINDDIENGKINAVQTRFPPNPTVISTSGISKVCS